MAEVSSKDAICAILGSFQGNVGVICWHDNELDAWRSAKKINDAGGKVKVVPVVDGNLTEKYNQEKAELFAKHYSKYC